MGNKGTSRFFSLCLCLCLHNCACAVNSLSFFCFPTSFWESYAFVNTCSFVVISNNTLTEWLLHTDACGCGARLHPDNLTSNEFVEVMLSKMSFCFKTHTDTISLISVNLVDKS